MDNLAIFVLTQNTVQQLFNNVSFSDLQPGARRVKGHSKQAWLVPLTSDPLPVSGSGSMLPLQGGHGDGRLQTASPQASPQAQVMTSAPRPPTPTQPPPQQQAAQQASQPPHPQQPLLPPPHPDGQNGYSSSKHAQSQAAFHSESHLHTWIHMRITNNNGVFALQGMGNRMQNNVVYLFWTCTKILWINNNTKF